MRTVMANFRSVCIHTCIRGIMYPEMSRNSRFLKNITRFRVSASSGRAQTKEGGTSQPTMASTQHRQCTAVTSSTSQRTVFASLFVTHTHVSIPHGNQRIAPFSDELHRLRWKTSLEAEQPATHNWCCVTTATTLFDSAIPLT